MNLELMNRHDALAVMVGQVENLANGEIEAVRERLYERLLEFAGE